MSAELKIYEVFTSTPNLVKTMTGNESKEVWTNAAEMHLIFRSINSSATKDHGFLLQYYQRAGEQHSYFQAQPRTSITENHQQSKPLSDGALHDKCYSDLIETTPAYLK